MTDYDVIIVGGGPVGVALAIELGMNNIRVLILDKHRYPLKKPRAQSLSARTMEFFMRWEIDGVLEDNLLLPSSLPQTGIWCSSLTGENYFSSVWGDNQLIPNASPKAGVRVPLWVTEEILRSRLNNFPNVDFFNEHDVQSMKKSKDHIIVRSFDRQTKTNKEYQATFLACCDGATGLSKKQFNNPFKKLSEKTQMLSLMFISKEIMIKKSIPDAIMYFILSDDAMAFVGPIDLNQHLWAAQVVWADYSLTPDEKTISCLIDKIAGTTVDKQIVNHYFWTMQVQIAKFFNLEHRVFWLGDAAHAFAPTGGLGLNTGFGDAHNLGWKLAAVIKNQASIDLLQTYEKERYPIWIENLNFAKKNAEEFTDLKKKYPPSIDYDAYCKAYANLGNQHLRSSGLTLGYGYTDSSLTKILPDQTIEHDPCHYTPKAKPGYFLPHMIHDGVPIYRKLSATQWNLIICQKHELTEHDLKYISLLFKGQSLHILKVALNTYPYTYLLTRPDWHISRVGNYLENVALTIEEFFQ